MKLTVVVAIHGSTDVFMSRVETHPENSELRDQDMLEALVQIMSVSALEEVLQSIKENLKDDPGKN